MICPKCAEQGQLNDSVVLDSRRYYNRTTLQETWVTRRRRCVSCGHKFTTYETLKGVDERKYIAYDEAVREDMA